MYSSGKTTQYDGHDVRETFHVHFIAFLDFDLEQYLQNLKKHYAFDVLKGAGTHAQSIAINIKPSHLRKLQASLPLSVLVSYEIIERPEKS